MTVPGKVDQLARKALAATADWHDTQTKPPSVHRVWERIHHECAEAAGPGAPSAQILGEAFRLLRQAADVRYQQYLSQVLAAHRARGTLGDVLHRAAGRPP